MICAMNFNELLHNNMMIATTRVAEELYENYYWVEPEDLRPAL
jgi:hypothetical protein